MLPMLTTLGLLQDSLVLLYPRLVTAFLNDSNLLMSMADTSYFCGLAARSGGTRSLQIPSASQGIFSRQRLMLWKPQYRRMMSSLSWPQTASGEMAALQIKSVDTHHSRAQCASISMDSV